ncbi:hypothetical protein PV10_04148 [Exophiala mesophila]|uniref:Transcription factor domain-containing protein n=1 Tax=Exophiala mesophila TaxID=212818 RepID=A0A0D1ZDV2_EXOME|nr:uncharacterized protein PV10_04148 [Exophiala mesophila]KIV92887.1 hypothetical protein PV10_04148 [Exophiala mesophila]
MAVATTLSPTRLSVDKTGPDNGRHHSTNYRRIRWREYEPKIKTSPSGADPFVVWTPPVTPGNTTDQEKLTKSRIKYRTSSLEPVSFKRQPVQRLSIPSPLSPLPCNATRADPFTNLPIKRTRCVEQSLDYFVTICHGLHGENSSADHNAHLSLLLPFTFQHAVLFESLIAVCRASVLVSLGQSAFEDKAFIHHRGQAMAGLNSRLGSKRRTDDAALLTAVLLMTLEYLIGNTEGVMMHSKGLHQMLRVRGNRPVDDESELSSPWATFVETGLVAYKALGSFVTGEAPDLPYSSMGFAGETFEELDLMRPLSYPQKPFSDGFCIILARLPAGFSAFCLTRDVSEQMVNIIASIHGALQTRSTNDSALPLPSPLTSPMDPAGNEHIRRQMVIQNLLSALQRMSLMKPQQFEIYISFGLVAFLHQFRRLAPLNLFCDPILREFVTILPQHSKPSSPEEQHALIWTSMSVAGVLALRIAPLPDSHTVMDRALDLYPEARQWEPLEKILQTFFWTPEIGCHWRKIWDVAMARREKLLSRGSTADVAADYLVETVQPPSTDWIQPPATDWIQDHIKGAPRHMREMGQALGICPFRPLPREKHG